MEKEIQLIEQALNAAIKAGLFQNLTTAKEVATSWESIKEKLLEKK